MPLTVPSDPAALPPGSGEVVVAAHGVTAGYAGTPAIHGIDLEARAGEVVALLGANGAGKTTTLLVLAGEIAPMSGTVVFRGDARRRRLHQRARAGLGFLTEERCVFMQLTGWQNLRLGRGRPERALELFPELEQHLDKPVGLLSGGQQQMLALGRVLAAEPRVLLADELSLGLAPMVVERLLAAVRAAADSGVAVVLVEQHVRQALAVADRVHVLRRGRVVLSGDAAELRGDADRSRPTTSPGDRGAMTDLVRFALLGLGTGGIYALLGLGLVVIYRGSGVINFAQAWFALVGAYLVYRLQVVGRARAVALAGRAVLACALLGVLVHFLVMRPLRTASPLARVIATLGVLTVLARRWCWSSAPSR